MKVVIDRSTCLSSGQCAYMQPEVFDFDDETGPSVKVQSLEAEQLAKAQDAVAMCPSQPLSIVDGQSASPEPGGKR